MKTAHWITLLALGLFIAVGCEKPNASTAEGSGEAGHDHAGHDHGDHDQGDQAELPAHGPNGGHLFRFAESDLIGEWGHEDAKKLVRLFVLKPDLKTTVAIDSVVMTPEAGNDKSPVELTAVMNDEEGKPISFESEDERLFMALNHGVTVAAVVEGKDLKGNIEAHAPHDH